MARHGQGTRGSIQDAWVDAHLAGFCLQVGTQSLACAHKSLHNLSSVLTVTPCPLACAHSHPSPSRGEISPVLIVTLHPLACAHSHPPTTVSLFMPPQAGDARRLTEAVQAILKGQVEVVDYGDGEQLLRWPVGTRMPGVLAAGRGGLGNGYRRVR